MLLGHRDTSHDEHIASMTRDHFVDLQAAVPTVTPKARAATNRPLVIELVDRSVSKG